MLNRHLTINISGWFTLLMVAIYPVSRVHSAQRANELHYTVQEEKGNVMIGNLYVDAGLHNKYSFTDLENVQFKFLTFGQNLDVTLESTTGVLRIGEEGIDRDEVCKRQKKCELPLDVVVTNTERLLEILKVVLEVKDLNDNAPVYRGDYNVGDHNTVIFQHYMPESAAVGSSFSIPAATDPDSGKRGKIRYELVNTDDAYAFELKTRQTTDGAVDLRIHLLQALDREHKNEYYLLVRAFDNGDPPRSGELVIRVNVTDVNDHSPVFTNNTYSITVYENIPRDTVLLQVSASDQDTGLYGTVIYSFSQTTQQQQGDIFAIHNVTGEVSVIGEVDYEQEVMYQLFVHASDLGPSSVPSEATVIVRVQDLNDNSPNIQVNTLLASGTNSAIVLEHAQVGAFVGQVRVTDPDQGENGLFRCALNLPEFELQERFPGEYQIMTSVELDREVKPRYDLSVVCQDKGNRPLQTTQKISVSVGDINDHAPKFTQPEYHKKLLENNAVGEFLLQVDANDEDIGNNADIAYHLEGADGLFHIDEITGRISALAMFDHEGDSPIEFTVIAVDNGHPRRSGSARVLVELIDMNDERPYFSKVQYSFGVHENKPNGSLVGSVIAYDSDSAMYSEITYMLWPSSNYFTINSLTGLISTTKSLDRETRDTYYLTVVAMDQGEPPLSGTASVTVFIGDKNDNSPVFEFPRHIDQKKPRSDMISSRRSSDPEMKYYDSLTVSASAPVGYLVTKLIATDRDSGENANLTYSSIKSDSLGSDLFTVNTQTGDVTVSQELSHIKLKRINFGVRVTDRGHPPLSDSSGFIITIDSAIPFIHQQTQLLTETNVVVLIVMATVSAILVTFLIIAIVVIYRRNQSRTGNERSRFKVQLGRIGVLRSCYSRPEKLRQNPDKSETPSSPGDFLFTYHSNGYGESPSYKLDLQRGESSHTGETSTDQIIADNSSHDAPSMISFGVEQKSRASQKSQVSHHVTDSIVHRSQSSSTSLRRVASPKNKEQDQKTEVTVTDNNRKELEVNELLKLLKQEREDADSAYSGGISSATNSITAIDGHDTVPNGHTRMGQNRMTDFIQSDCKIKEYDRSPVRRLGHKMKQPSLDSPISMTLNFGSPPNNQYKSSRSPPYTVRYTSVSTNENCNNNNNTVESGAGYHSSAGQESIETSVPSVSQTESAEASIASMGSSTQVVPNVNDISAIDGSYLGAIYEAHMDKFKYHRRRPGSHSTGISSDNTTMTEMSGIQYSCADVSEAMNHMTTKTPNNFRHLLMQTPQKGAVKDSAEHDVTSTTFKNGVSMATTDSCIDPQELVNRIDELFFKDMMV